MRNLAAEGIFAVIYNFISRTTPKQLKQAAAWWTSLDQGARDAFVRPIIDLFPGVEWALSLDDIRAMLAKYDGMGADGLRRNLSRFLQAVIPMAEEVGVRMAIHPDDPPFPVLGLPRIISQASAIDTIFQMADSPENGLCFCTGSFSAQADNDLPEMVREFAPRVHATHLRSTQRLPDGSCSRRTTSPARWTCPPSCKISSLNKTAAAPPDEPIGGSRCAPITDTP